MPTRWGNKFKEIANLDIQVGAPLHLTSWFVVLRLYIGLLFLRFSLSADLLEQNNWGIIAFETSIEILFRYWSFRLESSSTFSSYFFLILQ